MALQRPYEQLCNSSTIAHTVVYTNLKVLHKVLLEALLKLYQTSAKALYKASTQQQTAAVGAVDK
jgi:hypothetical protein